MCHGIPNSRSLKDGDIVNIDITVYYNGYHSDTSKTVMIGSVDQQGMDLVNHTKEALDKGIAICGPGVPFSEIGRVIGEFASKKGYSVSENFCGHGIGKQFHQPPYIAHFPNNMPDKMAENMTFTIEPILCQGFLTTLILQESLITVFGKMDGLPYQRTEVLF